MAGPMGRYRYINDAAQNYVLRLDASNAALTGATAADGTEANPPKGFRPRYVVARFASGVSRRLVCPDVSHGTWTGATTTLNLPDFGNSMASTAAALGRRKGEIRPGA